MLTLTCALLSTTSPPQELMTKIVGNNQHALNHVSLSHRKLSESTPSEITMSCTDVQQAYQDGQCCEEPTNEVNMSPHYHITSKKIQDIQTLMDDTLNATTKAKMLNYVVGNAFTGQEFELISGVNKDGSHAQKGGYMRWMSTTKVIGGITLAKALEEGILSLDDDVGKYIPSMKLEHLRVAKTCPLCAEKPPSRGILVSDLIGMSAGYSYDFYGNYNDGQMSGWQNGDYVYPLKHGEYPVLTPWTSSYYNTTKSFTSDEIMTSLVSPSHRLATDVGEVLYGLDLTIVGAVLSKALHAKGLNMTAAEYTKARFFDPLGMHHTWMSNGQLQPPADAANKLYELRVHKSSHIGVNHMLPSYVDTTKWLSDIPGDGFHNYEADTLMPKIEGLEYAGMYGETGNGPASDYVKFLKMLIRRGKAEDGTELVGEKYVRIAESHSLRDLWGSDWVFGMGAAPDPPGYPHQFSWGGWFGTSNIWDIKTGYYMYGGTQMPGSANGGFGTPDIWSVLVA